MNELFHQLANEGRSINRLRTFYASMGNPLPASRIELIIQLAKIKKAYNKK